LSNDSHKKRIFLVDDDLDNSAMFRLGLEELILDVKMPKMNGYELCEKMKNIDDKIKVCFLTASMDEYAEEYRAN
jgi:CheY-like chemotaxis protein